MKDSEVRAIVAEGHRASVLTSGTEKQREYRREYYAKNKERLRGQMTKYNGSNINRVAEIKANTPCKDCGRLYPSECMDFVRKWIIEKGGAFVSELVRSGSWREIEAEIGRCDLVCACCHRIRQKKERESRGVTDLACKSATPTNTEL